MVSLLQIAWGQERCGGYTLEETVERHQLLLNVNVSAVLLKVFIILLNVIEMKGRQTVIYTYTYLSIYVLRFLRIFPMTNHVN
jgi:hypothetical protein